MRGSSRTAQLVVICRVASRFCAIPVEKAEETMRPLPLEPLAGMPSFVLGLSIIRGAPTPVVMARQLLGTDERGSFARLLTLKVAGRRVALAVDEVLGIRDLARQDLGDLPPLLHEAGADVVSAIGALDASLLLLLRESRIVPESVWTMLESETAR